MWSAGGRDAGPGDRPMAVRAPGVYDIQCSFVTPTLAARRSERSITARRSERSRSSERQGRASRAILPLARRLLGGGRSTDDQVTCIACGASLPRSAAREYDKEGDRWDRTDKRFEYLCKSCHGELNHQPREELEGLLVELDAGEQDRERFLEGYWEVVEERYGSLEDED